MTIRTLAPQQDPHRAFGVSGPTRGASPALRALDGGKAAPRPAGQRSSRTAGRLPAIDEASQAGPFLKWVGGKGRLLGQLDALMPDDIERYIEPFVGGGAMFFHLRSRGLAGASVLADANHDVVNAWTVVRDEVDALVDALHRHERSYVARDDDGRAAYFYDVRARHPAELERAGQPMAPVERAARMLFLNRTCFNGLWRENSSGRFNTPHGRYARPQIAQRERLHAASRQLIGVQLTISDFRVLPQLARDHGADFVYLDPPYHPVSATSAFNAYAGGGFSSRDQRELGDVCRELDRMGVRFLLSNSDCPLIRDIYREFDVEIVRAPRAVNCRADRRGDVDEVAVRNLRRW